MPRTLLQKVAPKSSTRWTLQRKKLKEEEDKKRAGGAYGNEGAKRARTTADATTARKELLSDYHPTEGFTGARPGFVFKLGVKGLGYYEDKSLYELEARIRDAAEEEKKAERAERLKAATTEANPEEIELDMDLDEDDDAPEAPPQAAAASASNPEEIELDFEDLETAPIPMAVFGGSSTLANMRGAMEAEAAAVPEPALVQEEEEKPDPKFGSLGALAKFQRKGSKGKGKGG